MRACDILCAAERLVTSPLQKPTFSALVKDAVSHVDNV